jgi:hypothetical protein
MMSYGGLARETGRVDVYTGEARACRLGGCRLRCRAGANVYVSMLEKETRGGQEEEAMRSIAKLGGLIHGHEEVEVVSRTRVGSALEL